MSKAILVLDMPDSCLGCPLYHGDFEHRCKPIHKINHEFLNRPDWCPLKEFPKRDDNEGLYQLEYTQGYMSGWNACLNEILGE